MSGCAFDLCTKARGEARDAPGFRQYGERWQHEGRSCCALTPEASLFTLEASRLTPEAGLLGVDGGSTLPPHILLKNENR
jgi:hypothetical protein